jgi:membrane carboxypeptidase/penicillin-binding protein
LRFSAAFLRPDWVDEQKKRGAIKAPLCCVGFSLSRRSPLRLDEIKPVPKHAETGSRAAAPVWLDFMVDAVRGMPVKTFPIPEGVVFEQVDPETGGLVTDESMGSVIECFKADSLPTESGDYGRPSEGAGYGRWTGGCSK